MVQKEVKKEFDELAAQISRLEAIRDELDALDTKGFETEVHLIRARLKDVHALPEIEKNMRELREKIKLHERSQSHATRRGMSSESHLLKKKINELEHLITQKRGLSGKNALSTKEADSIRDIPQLERQLQELKNAFKTHIGTNTVKVDSGIGVIVDSKFDDFVSELKAELTKRVQEKEVAMDQTLKHDLAVHERTFTERYNHLVREFDRKYRDKVEHELHKEVSRRLEQEVAQKLEEERHDLLLGLAKENMAKLEHERRNLSQRLEHTYKQKMSTLTQQMKAFTAQERNLKAKAQRDLRKQTEVKARLNRLRISHESEMKQKEQNLALSLKGLDETEMKLKEALSRKVKVVEHDHSRLVAQELLVKRRNQLLAEKQRALDAQKKGYGAQLVTLKKNYQASLSREMKEVALSNQKQLHAKLKDIEKKRTELIQELKAQKQSTDKMLAQKMLTLSKKMGLLKAEEERYRRMKSKQSLELTKSHESLKAKYRMRVLQQEKKLHTQLAALKLHEQKEFALVSKQKKALQDKLDGLDRLRVIEQNRLNAQSKALESSLKAKMELALREQLRIKEQLLRKRLAEEYAVKVKTEIQKRSVEFDKRRVELEHHVIEQAKKLFK